MPLRTSALRYALLLFAGCSAETTRFDEPQIAVQALSGGALTTSYSSVAEIGGCSATLVTRFALLTAAHCVCADSQTWQGTCAAEKPVSFYDVVRIGESTPSSIVTTTGSYVIPYASYWATEWLSNDYAILRLKHPSDSQVVGVSPITWETQVPTVGHAHTLVGYGNHGTNCTEWDGKKRVGSTNLDQIFSYTNPIDGKYLVYNDTSIYACDGDSGGPAFSVNGKVVGVSSHGGTGSNSNYDPTYLAPVAAFIERNACPALHQMPTDQSFCNDPSCKCPTGEGDCDVNSHCAAGNICVTDVGLSQNRPWDMDMCWNPSYLATFYTEAGFWGNPQSFPVGSYDAYNLTIVGNDTISSMSINPGMMVRVCQHGAEWGTCENFEGDVSFIGATMNDQTSWIKVEPAVTLYAETNQTGAKQSFMAGTYNAGALTVVGNDNVSSMIAHPGINVLLCSETEGPGWGLGCIEKWGTATLSGEAMNNNTSYVSVRKGVTVYSEPDYTGTSQAFAAGTYDASQLTTIGNDTVSSMVVAPGMKATICKETWGGGGCKEFTGWVSFVGEDLNDHTSWIQVASL
jgi:hypothetical protein